MTSSKPAEKAWKQPRALSDLAEIPPASDFRAPAAEAKETPLLTPKDPGASPSWAPPQLVDPVAKKYADKTQVEVGIVKLQEETWEKLNASENPKVQEALKTSSDFLQGMLCKQVQLRINLQFQEGKAELSQEDKQTERQLILKAAAKSPRRSDRTNGENGLFDACIEEGNKVATAMVSAQAHKGGGKSETVADRTSFSSRVGASSNTNGHGR